MKRNRKAPKEQFDQQMEPVCPLFKRYYTGVCSGHKLPYAPTDEEKKTYCLTAGFRHCKIYGESTSMSRK